MTDKPDEPNQETPEDISQNLGGDAPQAHESFSDDMSDGTAQSPIEDPYFGDENPSDFDDPDMQDFSEYGADAGSGGRSLAELWQESAIGKVILLGVGVVGVSAYLFFGGDDGSKIEKPSQLPNTEIKAEAPGEVTPPSYEEAVREVNQRRVERAQETGSSALPTPIGARNNQIQTPSEDAEVDPLARWRRAAAERRAAQQPEPEKPAPTPAPAPRPIVAAPRPQPVQQVQAPVNTGPNYNQEIQSLSQVYIQQMQTLLGLQQPASSNVVVLANAPTSSGRASAPVSSANRQQRTQRRVQQAQSQSSQGVSVLVPAGDVHYARMLTEANSDVPGPILAQMLSGPLAGARLIGSFDVAGDQGIGEYLTIRFERATLGNKAYQIDAFAMDADTTLPGMADEVDRHYMTRVILPAAFSFIEGVASAMSERANTVTIVNGSVVESPGDLDTDEELLRGAAGSVRTANEILREDLGDRPPTVRVFPGTEMGLVFIKDVTGTL